ncbi:MAG: chaperone modulator CbpM [Bacteroidetes bacterium]|nr:chaperone modulator CbpM [Bacteroidota bacterium]
MKTDYLIAVEEFCVIHNIEISFIGSLQQNGLIEITTIKETEFINVSQLKQLEKFVRLYYDLDINIEGIETISHLLQRINTMQDEIITLRNRLRLYDSELSIYTTCIANHFNQ